MVKCREIYTNPGSEVHIVYSPVVKPDGHIELEESGKENIQLYIDSFAETCDIRLILARVQAGDMSALTERIGSYGDFTQFPKTYAELLQFQMDANKAFYKLPYDVRQKFDNDANQFFAQAGSSEFFEKCGIDVSVPALVESEVSNDE